MFRARTVSASEIPSFSRIQCRPAGLPRQPALPPICQFHGGAWRVAADEKQNRTCRSRGTAPASPSTQPFQYGRAGVESTISDRKGCGNNGRGRRGRRQARRVLEAREERCGSSSVSNAMARRLRSRGFSRAAIVPNGTRARALSGFTALQEVPPRPQPTPGVVCLLLPIVTAKQFIGALAGQQDLNSFGTAGFCDR